MTAAAAAALEALGRLKDVPDWLRPERLKAAMQRRIPEFASATMALEEVRPIRIRLDDQPCGGRFALTVEAPGGARRIVHLLGLLDAAEDVESISPGVPFGEDGWRCAVPELRLVLETPRADTALPALAILTDPSRAKTLLEDAIRTGSPAHAQVRIAGCTPAVARYKPGRRCTIVYRLEYGPEAEGRGWPEVVVAKTHRGEKGRIAYEGMRALWQSELRRSAAVTIPEPLGFLPELRVLIQGAVPGRSTLSDLLKSVLAAGTGKDMEDLRDLLAKAARGLAALHGCSAHGRPFGWQQEMADVRGRVERLTRFIPGFERALEPWLARLETLEALHPPQRPVPSHRSFRPSQVLLHDGHIAFIDFDGFCEAEPATDLALFRASVRQSVMRLGWREGRQRDILCDLDGLCDLFLGEYERMAPVSRERVALWETLHLLENVLNTWEHVRPEHLEGSMALFEHHLRQSWLSFV